MKWVLAVDNFLMDCIYDPAAEWFQTLFGYDNFFLARLFAILTTVAAIVSVALDKEASIGRGIVEIAALAWWTLRIVPVISSKVRSEAEHGFRNYLRAIALVPFAKLLCWSPAVFHVMTLVRNPHIYTAAALADDLLFLQVLYFSCCTPLPPGRSKIGKWFDSFGRKTALSS